MKNKDPILKALEDRVKRGEIERVLPAPPPSRGDEEEYGWTRQLSHNSQVWVLRKEAESHFDAFIEGQEEARAELIAEVERLELLCDGHRLEAAERKENERCLREEVARLRAALGLAAVAIEALATTQKDEGLGLLGSLMVPDTLAKIRAALGERNEPGKHIISNRDARDGDGVFDSLGAGHREGKDGKAKD